MISASKIFAILTLLVALGSSAEENSSSRFANPALAIEQKTALPSTAIALPPPRALSYPSPQTYDLGTAIVPLIPTVTGRVISYSVTPALPAGLSLNAANGQITGTPTTTTAMANYTVTAFNSSGSTAFVLSIRIKLSSHSSVDIQVSNSGVVDPEFDLYSNRYSYCEKNLNQPNGTLWVGTFNDDGSLDDYNAHPGTAIDSCLFQINGPEWGRDSAGAVITYVKSDPQGKATLAYVHEYVLGSWSLHAVPNLPQLTDTYNAVYPTDTLNSSARVLFVGTAGVEWRNLGGGQVPGAGGGLVTTEQGFARWATQYDSIAFMQSTGYPASKQLFVFNTQDGSTTQISNSLGDKISPHLWLDAVWGVVAVGVANTEIEVWQVSTQTKVATIPSPNGMPLQSLEHFVYQGRSYVYYYVENNALDGTKNNDLYITSIEPNYQHLKVSSAQLMSRIEPEIAFPTNGTPILYFSAKGANGKKNAVWRSALIALP